METLKCESGSHGITVGQLREWLVGLPADMLIAMSEDGESNGFKLLAEAEPNVRYDIRGAQRVHECDDVCEVFRVNEREFRGIAPDSDEWVDCEYTWGGPDGRDDDVHVVILWPAG